MAGWGECPAGLPLADGGKADAREQGELPETEVLASPCPPQRCRTEPLHSCAYHRHLQSRDDHLLTSAVRLPYCGIAAVGHDVLREVVDVVHPQRFGGVFGGVGGVDVVLGVLLNGAVTADVDGAAAGAPLPLPPQAVAATV